MNREYVNWEIRNINNYEFLWVLFLVADSKTKDAMEQINKRRIEMADGFKLLDVCLSQQEQGMV